MENMLIHAIIGSNQIKEPISLLMSQATFVKKYLAVTRLARFVSRRQESFCYEIVEEIFEIDPSFCEQLLKRVQRVQKELSNISRHICMS